MAIFKTSRFKGRHFLLYHPKSARLSMITRRPGKTFLKIYLVLEVILLFMIAFDGKDGHALTSFVNLTFSFLSFIPMCGYIFDKKFLRQRFWRLFAVAYIIWEVSCYTFIYSNSWGVSLTILFLLLPKYWCVVLYAWETLETDPGKKKTVFEKELKWRNYLTKRRFMFGCPQCESGYLEHASLFQNWIECGSCHRKFKMRQRNLNFGIYWGIIGVLLCASMVTGHIGITLILFLCVHGVFLRVGQKFLFVFEEIDV